MNRLSVALLASGILVGFSATGFAFECPSDMAEIDEALEGADLTDEQKQQVTELREEGERLHNEGSHQEAVDTLEQAKVILGLD